jgi:multicomponent Na+:H+ antiporter subunit B
MIKRLFSLGAVLVLAVLSAPLFLSVTERDQMGGVAEAYLTGAPRDLGAANVVTAVVVTYRGLDTLGEVTVLFAASAGVALALSRFRTGRRRPTGTRRQAPSELIVTGAGLLLPLILMFGVYIFVHGHLTPGGGFQGGVVIAAGVLLVFLAGTLKELAHDAMQIIEILAGTGYVAIGVLGLWGAAGFLDPRFLPTGQVGDLFSAGAIPVIYSLVGIKVGAELSGVLDAMRERGQE